MDRRRGMRDKGEKDTVAEGEERGTEKRQR